MFMSVQNWKNLFSQVPQEVYRDIVVESFKETYTPKSMSPTSAKLSSLVNNWLTQAL